MQVVTNVIFIIIDQTQKLIPPHECDSKLINNVIVYFEVNNDNLQSLFDTIVMFIK